jgi:hypothetical protein
MYADRIAIIWTGLDTLTQATVKLEFQDAQKYLLKEIYGE